MNAEFQKIGRRDKKAFLHDQCKEIEEKNRMGKTRDLFRTIRDTKGTFHAKSILESEVKVAQSCLTLGDPINYTVHGIL